MKTIQEIQADIVEEFAVFTDWMDKYEYLIELGKSMPLIEEKDKTESNLIRGCQSRVWLSCREEDGHLYFAADSDAIITKGIISLLLKVYDGQTPEAILAADEGFIEQIGLKENLSPTRANGLVSMIQTIKGYAAAWRVGAKAPGQPSAEGGQAAAKNELEADIVVALRQEQCICRRKRNVVAPMTKRRDTFTLVARFLHRIALSSSTMRSQR